MKKAIVVIALSFVAILAFSLFGCGGGGKTDAGDGYKIENQKLVKKGDDAYLAGTVTNTSDNESDILLSWYAYDSGKNGIGVAHFNANDIKPNEKYEFEVPFLDLTEKKSIRYDAVKEFLFGEAHFSDTKIKENLDKRGEEYKGDGYTLKNMKLVTSDDEPVIEGEFVNESGSEMSGTLAFDLIDENGRVVGKAEASLFPNIKDGQTDDFKTRKTYNVSPGGKKLYDPAIKGLVSSFIYNPEESTVRRKSS